MENKAFKIAGIKNLIKKNYDVPTDLIDLEAEVDDGISMRENWNKIKYKVIELCEKQHKILWQK